MAKHEVGLWIDHEVQIGNVDVQLPVRVDGKAFGRLQVSTGSVDWLPAGKKKSGYWLSWSEFAELMKQHGNTK